MKDNHYSNLIEMFLSLLKLNSSGIDRSTYFVYVKYFGKCVTFLSLF